MKRVITVATRISKPLWRGFGTLTTYKNNKDSVTLRVVTRVTRPWGINTEWMCTGKYC